jgi:hypothetical protein
MVDQSLFKQPRQLACHQLIDSPHAALKLKAKVQQEAAAHNRTSACQHVNRTSACQHAHVLQKARD